MKKLFISKCRLCCKQTEGLVICDYCSKEVYKANWMFLWDNVEVVMSLIRFKVQGDIKNELVRRINGFS